MPTYLIDGVKYKSEIPLTDDELEEIAGGDASDKQQDRPSYLAEAARRGLVRFPSQVYGAFKGALTGTGQTGAQAAVEEGRGGMLEALGSTGAMPQTQSQRILAAGVESAADPISYVMPGGSLAQRAGMLTVPVAKGIESFMAGLGAESGGIVGEKAGGMLGGETGEKIGRVGGALLGGTAAGVATGAIPRTAQMVKPAVNKARSLISKIRGNETIEAAEKMASGHIDNIFLAAAQADPKFIDVFEEAIKAQERTGIKMPLSAMMKDNAVINAYIGNLAAKHPQFREEFAKQFDYVKTGLGKKATKLFGEVSDADEFLEKAITAKSAAFTAAGKAVTRKTGEISSKAQKLTDELEQINPADFGSRVAKTVENAEDAARAATKPLYTKAFEVAKAKNVGLPVESVDDIYQTVVTGKNSDIFASFPSIYAKVKARFAPKIDKGAGLVDDMGKPLSKTTEKFAAASVDDLDSLKREINLQLRGARTDSHIRVLQDLKSKVNQHINSLDPDFVSAYKAADKAYLMKVGLPFNEETIKAIERAKFDENVVPLLTKNKSTVSQFIDTTGDQGKKLVEDAFVSEMTKNVKDGVLNTAKAKAWLASKREALSVVPDVRDRLNALVKDTDALMARKSQIESAFDAAAKARVLKESGMSAQTLVGRMYASPQYTSNFLKQYGNDKEAMKAVRSFMLDDILRSGDPLGTLADRTRGNIYDSVFGSAYKKTIDDLALISDRITKDPSSVAASMKDIDADMLTRMIGMKPERIMSLFATNPVVSKPVAIMTVLNRFVNKKAGDIAEQKMMDLMLDREASTRMLAAIKQSMANKRSLELGQYADWAKKRGYDFVDMLKQDAQAGAIRSYGGMDQDEVDRTWMEDQE